MCALVGRTTRDETDRGSRVSHGLFRQVVRPTDAREWYNGVGSDHHMSNSGGREKCKTPHRREAQAGRCSSLKPSWATCSIENVIAYRCLTFAIYCPACTGSFHALRAAAWPIRWARTRPRHAGIGQGVGRSCGDRDGQRSWIREHRVKSRVPRGRGRKRKIAPPRFAE